jgi:hypothetical protein
MSEKKERCLKRKQLYWVEEEEYAFYMYSRSGRYRDYHYTPRFYWSIWKDVFERFGITKDDLRRRVVYVEIYPRHRLRFVKIEKKNKKGN